MSWAYQGLIMFKYIVTRVIPTNDSSAKQDSSVMLRSRAHSLIEMSRVVNLRAERNIYE